jgi:hypothetical protein
MLLSSGLPVVGWRAALGRAPPGAVGHGDYSRGLRWKSRPGADDTSKGATGYPQTFHLERLRPWSRLCPTARRAGGQREVLERRPPRFGGGPPPRLRRAVPARSPRPAGPGHQHAVLVDARRLRGGDPRGAGPARRRVVAARHRGAAAARQERARLDRAGHRVRRRDPADRALRGVRGRQPVGGEQHRRPRPRNHVAHRRGDRAPVVLGGALPGHGRGHRQRDPHPRAHARECGWSGRPT